MKVTLSVILLCGFLSACASTPSATGSNCADQLDGIDQQLQAVSDDIDAANPTDMAASMALTGGLNASIAEIAAARLACSDANVRCSARFEALKSFLDTEASELAKANVDDAKAKSRAVAKLNAALGQLQTTRITCVGSVP